MAVTTNISSPLFSTSSHSLTSFQSLQTPFQLRITPRQTTPLNSISTTSSSSMNIQQQSPLQTLKTSFLDTRESGFLHFVKYHGLGNDFIPVDNRESMEPKITPDQAVKLCDRNFGVGADGVIFAMPVTDGTDYTMRIFNSDGSEPDAI